MKKSAITGLSLGCLLLLGGCGDTVEDIQADAQKLKSKMAVKIEQCSKLSADDMMAKCETEAQDWYDKAAKPLEIRDKRISLTKQMNSKSITSEYRDTIREQLRLLDEEN